MQCNMPAMETTSKQQETEDASISRKSGDSNTATSDWQRRQMTPSTARTRHEQQEQSADDSPATVVASQAFSPASSSSSSSSALEKYITPHGTSSEQSFSSSADEENLKLQNEEQPKVAASHQTFQNESSTATTKTAVESTKLVRQETSAQQSKQTKQPKQQRQRITTTSTTRNELTHLVPGYVAPMRLETTPALDAIYRPVGGLEALRKQAIRSDPILSRAVPLHKTATASSRSRKMTPPHPAVGFLATRTTVAPEVAAATAANSIRATTTITTTPMTVFKTGTSGDKSRQAKRGPPPNANDAGDGWFHMRPTPLSQELKHDLQLIRNRNFLDPKRFYKSLDTSLSQRGGAAFCQQGTVVEGPTEYYSSRLTKKQRGTHLVDEVLADASLSDYARNQYRKRQQEASAAQALRRSSFSSSRNKKHKGSKRR